MLNKSKIQFINLEIAKVYLPSKYNQILNKAKLKFINLEIANAKKVTICIWRLVLFRNAHKKNSQNTKYNWLLKYS